MISIDQSAMLAAIRDNLADDAPRLIYADWLDEHGEPERAELIRVQCELARLECDSCKGKGSYSLRVAGGYGMRDIPCDGCNAKSLRRRERELWGYLPDRDGIMSWFKNQLPDGWCTILNCDTGYGLEAFPKAIASRGFLSTITTTMATWYGETCLRCAGHAGMNPCSGCGGRGPIYLYTEIQPCPECGEMESSICLDCNGTRRVNAHGSAIVRAECAAVERVEFSDKSPYYNGKGYSWYDESRGNPSVVIPESAGIPKVLFNKLQHHKSYRWKDYNSEADAIAALSRAAIELASTS